MKGVIKPNENYDTHNINSTGIVTAIGLDVNGNGDISGNLNVEVLTYEDVTSIDSVGVISARVGIDCNGDIDVDGHTNLDNACVAGVSTFSDHVSIQTQGTENWKPADLQLVHTTHSVQYQVVVSIILLLDKVLVMVFCLFMEIVTFKITVY